MCNLIIVLMLLGQSDSNTCWMGGFSPVVTDEINIKQFNPEITCNCICMSPKPEVIIPAITGYYWCQTGPGKQSTNACKSFDFNQDGDVDMVDFAHLQRKGG